MTLWGDLREGCRISWSAVRANTMRSVLTTLGIVVGVVTVTLMGTAISGLNEAFMRSLSMLGTDVLYVQKFPWFQEQEWWRTRNRRDLHISDARAISRQAEHALAVSVEAHLFKTIKYQDRSAPAVWIVGNNEESGLVRGLNIVDGRFFLRADVEGLRPVCVLGAAVAETFFPHGSAIGERLKVEEVTYEIIGVIGKMGQFMGGFNFDNQVIIPITRMRADFQRHPEISIMVKVRDLDMMAEAREEIHGIMRQRRKLAPGADDDFAINEQGAFLAMFQRVAGTIAAAGLFITGLSLFVGGIGIMNIMFVSVAERTREIGIRKALGARRRSILLQFLLEAAMICLIGGAVGVLLAWGLTFAVSLLLPARMSPAVVGAALLVSLLTGLASGFFPAWRAARMSPVEALRTE